MVQHPNLWSRNLFDDFSHFHSGNFYNLLLARLCAETENPILHEDEDSPVESKDTQRNIEITRPRKLSVVLQPPLRS